MLAYHCQLHHSMQIAFFHHVPSGDISGREEAPTSLFTALQILEMKATDREQDLGVSACLTT